MIPLWRQIQRENFTQFEALADYLELAEPLRKRVLKRPRFALNVPRRLAAKMAKNTLDDPIFRQFVPLEEELVATRGFETDPVQDGSFQRCGKLLHKYAGRALLLTTGACAMHCRYCFRQNFPYEAAYTGFEKELEYIRADETLEEIILSGGDPLSLSDAVLGALLEALSAIPHVKVIRFHSRFPIGIPERIDPSFLALLERCRPQIFFVVHCNHPRELDEEVAAALKRLQRLGIPVLNQAVLLKGVNDAPETLLALCKAALHAGILPYYLHELDRVQGTAHFEAAHGGELLQFVQENLAGFGVPRLAREEPGMKSKSFKIY